uniref:Uncharacterized protein n=1 Tax=Fusarium oxysporum (strain Fo5176) TaxID=660025 RepID=A0A0D2XRN3_FUSOF
MQEPVRRVFRLLKIDIVTCMISKWAIQSSPLLSVIEFFLPFGVD